MKTVIVTKVDTEKSKKTNQTDAQKLISIREDLRLTQQQLSKRLNISQSTISYVEQGTRKAPYSLKVALNEEFNIDFDGIYSYEELKQQYHKSKQVVVQLRKTISELKEEIKELKEELKGRK